MNAAGVWLIFSDHNKPMSLKTANTVTDVGGGEGEILPLTQIWVS